MLSCLNSWAWPDVLFWLSPCNIEHKKLISQLTANSHMGWENHNQFDPSSARFVALFYTNKHKSYDRTGEENTS
jgi:hypothetical protein